MWIADRWDEYRLLDASGGEKLEDWAGYILIRPDPQVIWTVDQKNKFWKRPSAHYHRSSQGGGRWEIFDLPVSWTIHYSLGIDGAKTRLQEENNLSEGILATSGYTPGLMIFHLKPFAFKHTGVFPEQSVSWEFIYEKISSRILSARINGGNDPVNVLNLFAYTGGATIAAAMAGARVVHVDASKGMVSWAKENAASSGLKNAPIRWLIDDVRKFMSREVRRGHRYDAIIMDPPSYGRGPKGEIWKLEDDIFPLIQLSATLLSDQPLFFMINSYTTGLSAGVMKAMLDLTFRDGHSEASELGLKIYQSPIVLPEGVTARYIF